MEASGRRSYDTRIQKENPEVIEEMWYNLWKPKQHPEKIVKQLSLPKQYRQVICKLANAIPLAGHLGRDKTVKRITNRDATIWVSTILRIAL